MTERDVVLNEVFVYWIDGLVGGNKIAIEMRKATKENVTRRHARSLRSMPKRQGS